MAGYRALSAAGLSIVKVLSQRIAETNDAPPNVTVVLAGTNDLDAVDDGKVEAVIKKPAISLFCYRITVDKDTRPGCSAVASTDGIPRIPLRMHFLLAAWSTRVEEELTLLGLAAQILERDCDFTGPTLDPSGEWRSGERIQIIPDDLSQDSMSEAFEALTTKYRLSLPYVARVICIEAPRESTSELTTSAASGLETIS